MRVGVRIDGILVGGQVVLMRLEWSLELQQFTLLVKRKQKEELHKRRGPKVLWCKKKEEGLGDDDVRENDRGNDRRGETGPDVETDVRERQPVQ